MTRSQIRQMVDELAEDLRTFVFQALDAEIWIQAEEAGRVAATIERAFLQEMDTLFTFDDATVKSRSP